MQHKPSLKYILDIEAIITELEFVLQHHHSDFMDFNANFISVRAVERDFIILGEAINKLTKIDSNLKITSAKDIIGLRNLIVHAYDAIDPAVLWKILIKDLPQLKKEIEHFRTNP